MNHDVPSYEDTHALLAKYVHANTQHWLHDDLFSLNWWLMLFVTLLFYVVWVRSLHKERLTEILLFGSLVTVISLVIDIIGVALLWWGYPDNLIPLEPAFLVLDLSQMPIAFSAVYQRYGDNTKRFFWAMTALSAAYSFLIEPLLSWLGIYQLYKWEYWYSFPIYILLALIVRYVVHSIIRIEKQARSERKKIH